MKPEGRTTKVRGFVAASTDTAMGDEKPIDSMSFEEALAELEGIVGRLEQGRSTLEDAIGAYDRGAALKRHCEAKLREAQERVERIAQRADGSVSTEPMKLD